MDTAGIRRRGKVASGPAAERFSALRALRAIGRADVAVLVLDAVDGLTAQDAHVAGYVVDEGVGLVVAVNKWDLVEERPTSTFDQYVARIRGEAPFLDFAPIISISAKTGPAGRTGSSWRSRSGASAAGGSRRPSSTGSSRMRSNVRRRRRSAGRRPRFFYATQAAIEPPTFVLFASDAAVVHFSYRRYLENRLRDAFGFGGTPIRLVFREQSRARLQRSSGSAQKQGDAAARTRAR